MKTTVDLPDDLMTEVKIEAAVRRRKLKELIPDLLRAGLAADRERRAVQGESFSEQELEAWLAGMREIGADIQRRSVDPRSLVEILHDDRR